jgi:predicted nucleic acid-binding protein
MATTHVRRIFVDTNVLTHATISAAPLHVEARATLDALWTQSAQLHIRLFQVLKSSTKTPPPAPLHAVAIHYPHLRHAQKGGVE